MKIFIVLTSILVLNTSCKSDNITLTENNTNIHKKIQALSERAPEPFDQLHKPFNFPLVLSGNFGELRPNHFHSGIDFKTQGKINQPINCAYDGYVSKISISGGGYGRALYVTHPSIGLTTVYAHLNKYAPKIDSLVTAEQHRLKTFDINLSFNPNNIIVTKGEIIAYSGNSGHSFGPHLHMEIRHTESGDALDPLPYFKNLIKDNTAPIAHNISLFPVMGQGCVNSTNIPSHKIIKSSENLEFNAWGKVYPAIKANDYMNDTHNVFGVKHLILKVDGEEVYHRIIDRFKFNATRAINTLVDYYELNKNGSWYMHTKIPESKPLGCMIESSPNNGIIDIIEERAYKCEFILKDEHQNSTSIKFTINGVKEKIQPHHIIGKEIKYNISDTINFNGLNAIFYEYCFYDNINLNIEHKESNEYLSPIYSIGNMSIPIAQSYRIAIDITNDKLTDKEKYCIVRINKGKQYAIRSLYRDGKMIAYVNRFGSYAVSQDITSPKINPYNEKNWAKSGIITFKISDNLSGIKKYYGTIDGQWVMFEADTKNSIISYNSKNKKLKGKHTIKINVIDYCNNNASYTKNIVW